MTHAWVSNISVESGPGGMAMDEFSIFPEVSELLPHYKRAQSDTPDNRWAAGVIVPLGRNEVGIFYSNRQQDNMHAFFIKNGKV